MSDAFTSFETHVYNTHKICVHYNDNPESLYDWTEEYSGLNQILDFWKITICSLIILFLKLWKFNPNVKKKNVLLGLIV